MRPQLGFFEQFKGADTVLLAPTPQEVAALAHQLQQFAQSSATSLQIDAEPIPEHVTHLTVVRELETPAHPSGFRWLCGPAQALDIAGKLTALAAASSGHQYFELLGSRVQLLISVGEGYVY
jgi:hypothetical protein